MKLSIEQLRRLIRETSGEFPSVIKAGESYHDPEGNTVTVTEISVSMSGPMGSAPVTWISYQYETVDGRSGSEKNTATAFIKILRGA